jgi:hypothetical protein
MVAMVPSITPQAAGEGKNKKGRRIMSHLSFKEASRKSLPLPRPVTEVKFLNVSEPQLLYL